MFLGPLDPSKSGFVGQSTVVVCTVGMRHQLLLEPRDEYGNLCNYEPENDSRNNYKISITEVSRCHNMYYCFIISSGYTPSDGCRYEFRVGNGVFQRDFKGVGREIPPN